MIVKRFECHLGELIDVNPETLSVSKYKGSIQYIDIASVNCGQLDGYTEYDIADAPGRARRIIKDNDIIYSTVRPNLRAYYYVKNCPDNAICSTGFAVLRAKENVDSRFIYSLVTENSFVNYLSLVAKGSAYPAVDTADFKKAKVTVPDLQTQKRIAEILSAYDDLIENNNRRIALLEKAAQELYKEWFVRFRFPGYENAKFENGLPDGWKVDKLESILVLEDHKREPLSEQQRSGMQPLYPYYGACSVAGYVDNYIFDGIYLLLSEDGANVVDDNGCPTLQYVWGQFWVNNHAHIISKNGIYSVEFLHVMLKNTNMQSIVTGAAQPKISQKRLLGKKVIVPSADLVRLFSQKIEPMYERIRYLTEDNRNLTKQRDLLLPRLMSGKLEV